MIHFNQHSVLFFIVYTLLLYVPTYKSIFKISYMIFRLYMYIEKYNLRTRSNARAFVLVPTKESTVPIRNPHRSRAGRSHCGRAQAVVRPPPCVREVAWRGNERHLNAGACGRHRRASLVAWNSRRRRQGRPATRGAETASSTSSRAGTPRLTGELRPWQRLLRPDALYSVRWKRHQVSFHLPTMCLRLFPSVPPVVHGISRCISLVV
jgi:hypothetical protein